MEPIPWPNRLKEFAYVPSMGKLLAWRSCDAVHGGGDVPLGTRRTLGPILWTGRDPVGVAFDAGDRAEARLRVDEGVGNEIGGNLQGECRSDLSRAAAIGGRMAGDLGHHSGQADL